MSSLSFFGIGCVGIFAGYTSYKLWSEYNTKYNNLVDDVKHIQRDINLNDMVINGKEIIVNLGPKKCIIVKCYKKNTKRIMRDLCGNEHFQKNDFKFEAEFLEPIVVNGVTIKKGIDGILISDTSLTEKMIIKGSKMIEQFRDVLDIDFFANKNIDLNGQYVCYELNTNGKDMYVQIKRIAENEYVFTAIGTDIVKMMKQTNKYKDLDTVSDYVTTPLIVTSVASAVYTIYKIKQILY